METTSNHSLYAADAAHEFASAHNFFDLLEDASPAISLLHTPSLEAYDTPDSVISHDFSDYSPKFSSVHSFGGDASLFDDHYVSRDAMFGDRALFPLAEDDFASVDGAKLAANRSHSVSGSTVEPSLFVPATALSLPVAGGEGGCSFTAPASPALDFSTRPSMSRTSSTASSFAVPKLPKCRKRKTSLAGQITDVCDKLNPASKRKSQDEDDEDEKAALRAKNTEAAARSRARKKAAMEMAENRIRQLEEENHALKRQLAQSRKETEALLARCQD